MCAQLLIWKSFQTHQKFCKNNRKFELLYSLHPDYPNINILPHLLFAFSPSLPPSLCHSFSLTQTHPHMHTHILLHYHSTEIEQWHIAYFSLASYPQNVFYSHCFSRLGPCFPFSCHDTSVSFNLKQCPLPFSSFMIWIFFKNTGQSCCRMSFNLCFSGVSCLTTRQRLNILSRDLEACS